MVDKPVLKRVIIGGLVAEHQSLSYVCIYYVDQV